MGIVTKFNPLGTLPLKKDAIIQVACAIDMDGEENGGDTTWALKADGTLWGCGRGDYGQQGNGSTSNVTTFTQRLTDVKKVVCSPYTTWALKADGTLWGCGRGDYGQQGNGSTSNITTFTQRLTDVQDVVCSRFTTWALKADGTLWGCGRGDYGQQGNNTTSNVTTFTQRLTKVSQIACCGYTTWAIANSVWYNNRHYGCGYGGNGQQGTGNTNNSYGFHDDGVNCKEIQCTYRTTHILTNTGWYANCGENAFGKLGNNQTSGSKTEFGYIFEDYNEILKFKISNATTWVIKNDSTLWGCGYNGYGQQGNGTTGNILSFTQRLTDVQNVTCSYFTTWALKNDSTLWGCGYNSYGQQGNRSTSNVTTFTQRLTDVQDVVCSASTTWVIKNDGTLWGCGYNNYGQQGNGNTTDVTTFTQAILE